MAACATGSSDESGVGGAGTTTQTTSSGTGGGSPSGTATGTSTGADPCPGSFSLCLGECVDTDTDEAHCGNCDTVCDPGYVCSAGSCELSCQAGLVACDDSCIDPLEDAAHCGASGDCAGANAGAVCDPLTEACVDGACEPVCPAGEIMCDGACVDPLSDVDYCGASGDCLGNNAGVVCGGPTSSCPGAADEICQGGQCAPGCPTGGEALAFSGQLLSYPLPSCVAELTVTAWGAQGGSSSGGSAGGLGAMVEGTVCVTPGTTLTIVVGEQAPSAPYPCGGGGGSFVADGNTPLLVAGGGGGGYFNWAPGGAATMLVSSGPGVGGTGYNDAGGGGGFTLDGAGTSGSGGIAFLHGAGYGLQFPGGNTNASRGGFGGGGGASQSGTFNAGGGGGFDGGVAGNGNGSTGGASFITPSAMNTSFSGAVRSGHGLVELAW